MTFAQPDFQIPQKSADSEPEIVPHHHYALHLATVTLPQGVYQPRVRFGSVRMEPLLELDQDDHHLLAQGDVPPAP